MAKHASHNDERERRASRRRQRFIRKLALQYLLDNLYDANSTFAKLTEAGEEVPGMITSGGHVVPELTEDEVLAALQDLEAIYTTPQYKYKKRWQDDVGVEGGWCVWRDDVLIGICDTEELADLLIRPDVEEPSRD